MFLRMLLPRWFISGKLNTAAMCCVTPSWHAVQLRTPPATKTDSVCAAAGRLVRGCCIHSMWWFAGLLVHTLLASIWSTIPRITFLLMPLVKRKRMPAETTHTLHVCQLLLHIPASSYQHMRTSP